MPEHGLDPLIQSQRRPVIDRRQGWTFGVRRIDWWRRFFARRRHGRCAHWWAEVERKVEAKAKERDTSDE
jgi:hypothetical protein